MGVVFLAVAAIYTYAWFDDREPCNPYPHTRTRDQAGKNVHSPTDPATSKYLTHSGYTKLQRIWSDFQSFSYQPIR